MTRKIISMSVDEQGNAVGIEQCDDSNCHEPVIEQIDDEMHLREYIKAFPHLFNTDD
jgi:hypothetical protein